MAKYRKRDLIIDAVLVDHLEATLRELEELGAKGIGISRTPPGLLIETLEGTMRADVGDWVIRGVVGEFYPVKPDVFHKTYEEA